MTVSGDKYTLKDCDVIGQYKHLVVSEDNGLWWQVQLKYKILLSGIYVCGLSRQVVSDGSGFFKTGFMVHLWSITEMIPNEVNII